MTALEKIKEMNPDELEKEGYCSKEFYTSTNEPFPCGQCGYSGQLLYKAFRVMREIAIQRLEDCDWLGNLDKEFEERMKDVPK